MIVSLNPSREPAAGTVMGEWEVDHPVFDRAAVAAQERLPALQGRARTWYAGAWTRYGFHEDGLLSAQLVVDAMRSRGRLAPAAAGVTEAVTA